VAAGTSGRGAALIAVDGLSARPYSVGMPVGEGLVLQSVQGRRAQLGPALQGPTTVVLELPPLPR
jgi:general secretion pathway protein C